MSEIDLEPFGRIVARLGEAVALLEADPANESKRDSVIKRFELAYEPSRNTLRKFLLSNSVHLRIGVDESYANMIRTASQDGLLLGDLRCFTYYQELRNRTAHTYNEDEADRVVAEIPGFLEEARHPYAEMKKREEAQ